MAPRPKGKAAFSDGSTIAILGENEASSKKIKPNKMQEKALEALAAPVSYTHLTISKYNRSWPGYQSAAYNGTQPAFQMCPSSTHQRSLRHVQLLPYRCV